MADCTECEEKYSKLLNSLPCGWKEALVSVICSIPDARNVLTCEKIKDCETTTSLSTFYFDGSLVCIDYTDEAGETVTKCFDLNRFLDGLDPKCLGTQEEWDEWTFIERIQAIFNNATEDGCEETTSTTTTTTTICPEVTDIIWNYVET